MKMKMLRKLLLIASSIAITSSLASCVTIVSPLEETYYVTEYVTDTHLETFSETVPIATVTTGEDTLIPYLPWNNPSLAFKGHTHVWHYGYVLNSLPRHDDEKIKITFSRQQYYEYTTVQVF